jgi:alpha-galactosidase
VPLFRLPAISLGEPQVTVSAKNAAPFPGALETLQVEVLLTEGPLRLRLVFELFPGHGAIRSQVYVLAPPLAETRVARGPDAPLEMDPANLKRDEEDWGDAIALGLPHLKVRHVQMWDRSDDHDQLVDEGLRLCHPIRREAFDGNLFILEDHLAGSALLLAKEGPTPEGQLNRRGSDLILTPTGSARLSGTGLGPRAYDPLNEQAAYGWTILAGEPDELRSRHRALSQRRSQVAGRPERFVMSNTWGDRNRDAALNEAFMLKEIDAAAAAGADMIMIDDGWQTGRTSNSALSKTGVWENYWETQPDFWKPDLGKFPRGLDPLVEAAKTRGASIALWYSPDSSSHFAQWERDAKTLLELHRRYGITAFKLDGIHLRSKVGESHLRRFFERLHAEAPSLVLCLDVTAQIRPGYLPWPEHVHLFVENRYTDWGNYHPHRTLRTLWQLGRWLPASRLQMEILNPRRHPEKYEDDALAPMKYDMKYVTAVGALSQPLLWMEVQHLAEPDRRDLAEVMALFKPILAGEPEIEPVGDLPDGTSWTGFRIRSEGAEHLLVFREWNERQTARFGWKPPAGSSATLVFSNRPPSEIALAKSGEEWEIRMDQAASVALWRLG